MKEQFNPVSKVIYQGRNQLELQTVKAQMGYKSDEWVTFLQAKELGRKIKKGEHGVSVFKGYGTVADIDKKTKKAKWVSAPLGYARVFNLEQTEEYKK
jgi:antirestriction protein ArdC